MKLTPTHKRILDCIGNNYMSWPKFVMVFEKFERNTHCKMLTYQQMLDAIAELVELGILSMNEWKEYQCIQINDPRDIVMNRYESTARSNT